MYVCECVHTCKGVCVYVSVIEKKEYYRKSDWYICVTYILKVKLVTVVEGYPKAPFSIATTPWV